MLILVYYAYGEKHLQYFSVSIDRLHYTSITIKSFSKLMSFYIYINEYNILKQIEVIFDILLISLKMRISYNYFEFGSKL